MDNHHIAQYGLIGALIVGAGAGYHALSSRPPVVNAAHVGRVSPHVWPPLADAEVAALTTSLASIVKGKAITVYCINADCADLAEDVAGALKAAGATVRAETPMNAADGLEVGSDDPAGVARLGSALTMVTSLKPKIGPPHHGETYVSFGRRVD